MSLQNSLTYICIERNHMQKFEHSNTFNNFLRQHAINDQLLYQGKIFEMDC